MYTNNLSGQPILPTQARGTARQMYGRICVPLLSAVLCARCQMVGEAMASGRCIFCASKGVVPVSSLITPATQTVLPGETLSAAMARVKQQIVLAKVKESGGQHKLAAEQLGISRNLISRLKHRRAQSQARVGREKACVLAK